MRTLFLKLLPYLLSIVIGTVIYILADLYIKDIGLNTLIVNIAAGLLSIPFIFICYELVNDFCSRDIKSTLLVHVSFEINGILLDVVPQFRALIGSQTSFNKDELDSLLAMNANAIQKSLSIEPTQADEIQKAKNRLQDLIYKNSANGIFTDTQIQTLFTIAKNLGIVAKELSLTNSIESKKVLSKTMASLFKNMSIWLDACEEDEIVNHHSFTLIR